MAVPAYRLFIDGQAVDTSDHYDLRYPFNGEVVGTVARAGEDETDAAIASAVHAYDETRRLGRAQRAEILSAMSRGVAERRSDFERAITLGTGKPIDYARAEVGRTVGVLALAAEEVKRFGQDAEPIDFEAANKGSVGIVERFPIGPISAIAPFNFPLNLVTHKVAPAIATGNTMVVKPPPQCPGPALTLAELAAHAGLPKGALNVISADPPVAERLAVDERIKMVSFTGCATVGWALRAIAGTKRVALELGGNGGLIVDDGADLEYAATRTARGAFLNAGQVCLSVQRIFVHRNVYFAFLKHLVDGDRALGVGDPMDERTVVGPLISSGGRPRDGMDRRGQGRRRGVLTGDRRTGNVVAPTLVELSEPKLHRLRVWSEEIFGPVATVEPINSFAEGVAAHQRFALRPAVKSVHR